MRNPLGPRSGHNGNQALNHALALQQNSLKPIGISQNGIAPKNIPQTNSRNISPTKEKKSSVNNANLNEGMASIVDDIRLRRGLGASHSNKRLPSWK